MAGGVAKIRDDVEGVVLAYDGQGGAVTLRAGDNVPDGVSVGEHVVSDVKPSRSTSK